jgi:5-formyltetrahydrofolate cyclo-ligase
MTKNEIRKIYLAKRKLLSEKEISEMTSRMLEYFNHVSMGNAGTILSYSPLSHRNEFDVGLCETSLLSAHQGIKIAHPRIIQNSNFMEAVIVNTDTRFTANEYSITEPSHGEVLTPESFDLVLVPLLAFDTKGFRVGYGKGFYDRWLAQCRPGIIKVGFSYFEPVGSIGDINEFDVPLNFCITPMRVYEF